MITRMLLPVLKFSLKNSRHLRFAPLPPLTLTPSEVSRNRQQRTAIKRSMRRLILRSFPGALVPLLFKPHRFPSALMGETLSTRSIKSDGTGVLCEARRGPFGAVVNEGVMQRVASPFPHPHFLPSIPICRHIVVKNEMQRVVLICVCVSPTPISTLLFWIVNSAQRLNLLIYSLARLGLHAFPCGRG